MEFIAGATGSRRRQTPSSDRFLSIFTPPQPETALGDELSEEDIFWTVADAAAPAEHNHQHSTPSFSSLSSSVSFNFHHYSHNYHHHQQPKNFGILAVLPKSETRSVFNRKASVSSSNSSSASSSSSSRMMIPKRPPLDRTAAATATGAGIATASPVKFHQSAPLNVPVLSEAMRGSRATREFDDIDDDDDKAEGDILPPHELVAARQTPIVSCSVLEGVGRTLKGRDLRQVRNAIWRKTGFLD